MVSIVGWMFVIFFTGLLCAIGWWQWRSYATLDRRIEMMDSTLLDSAGTRIEKVLDAPNGSVVVPYVAATMVPVQQYVVQPAPVRMVEEH